MDHKPEEQPKDEVPKPSWEYRTEFEINKRMKHVVNLAIGAAQAELTLLRRKLEKLHYGS